MILFLGVNAWDTCTEGAANTAQILQLSLCPTQIQASTAPISCIDFSETQGCLKSGPDTDKLL